MSVRSAQSITQLFTTRRFDTGAATNADSLPTGTLYVNGTANAAAVTVTNITTGVYKWQVTLPTLAVGDRVDMRINATVNSVADNAVVWQETKDLVLSAAYLPDVILADAVAHGGTLGSSTATIAFSRMVGVSQTANTAAFDMTGNGSEAGMLTTGGASGDGFDILAGGGGASGIWVLGNGVGYGASFTGGDTGIGLGCFAGTTGDAVVFLATSGHGLNITAAGSGKHGILSTGGTNGDGARLVGAGTGFGLDVVNGSSLGAVSATTITASGTTSLAAVTTSGTVTLNALTVSNATTLSGAVSLGSTLGVTGTTSLAAVNTSGTVTFNAFTVTNALTVSGATTLTGAVAASNASNNINLGTGAITAGVIADNAIDRATFAVDTGMQTVRSNTAQAGNASSITLDASASATNNFYVGQTVYLTGGTGAGQARVITGYNGSTKVATVSRAWITAPASGTTFALAGTDSPRLNASLNVTAAVAQTVIRSGTAQAGSTANTIKLDSGASSTNNLYNGTLITITGGTGLGQARTIIGYVGSTKVATVDRNWVTTPDATSTFDIYASTNPTTFSDEGVAQAGAATTITLQSTASATDSIYNGSLVVILSGTGVGQAREITAYNGTTKVATVDSAWATNPDSTSGYAVIPTQASAGLTSSPTAADIALAVGHTIVPGIFVAGELGYVIGTNLDTTVSSRGTGTALDASGVRSAVGLASANLDTQLSGIQSDTNDIQTRLPAALVGGRMDSSVGAMAANTLTASALASDAVTEIQAGLSSLDAAGIRTAIGLATANLDTQLSGIQSDTDNIQTRIPAALVSGRMDSSVGAMAANTLTASALATDAVTEIQTGLSTLDAAGIRTAVGLASANLDTQLSTIDDFLDTEIAAIKAKTDLIPASPASVGDIPTFSQIWTTALTESYRGTNAAGTPAQILHETLQNITEFSISGTTKTVKKFDGSTTAKTYTLNSATVPTAITETT